MMTRAPYRSLRGLAAVTALLALAAVGCSEASEVVDDAKDGAKKAARQRSVFSLDVGDCYNPNGGKVEGEAYLAEVVPCDEAHQGEVVGEFALDGGSEYPGDEKVVEIADGRCAVEAQTYAPDTWALPKGVGLSHYTPTRESWATGDRAVSCTYTVEKGTFKGSLNTAKSFEPDQLTFLKGSNAVYETLWAHQPVTDDVEAALKDYKAQAKAVAADRSRRGCMLAKSAAELATTDDAVRRAVEGCYARWRAELIACIKQAQRDGDIDAGQNPQALATTLLAFLRGLEALRKGGAGPAQLKAAAEQMIALLPPGRASGTKARRHGNKTGRAGAASS